jgi:hypothetical protein
MNENPKYTIDIVPVGDYLEMIIPEIGVTVETAPGEVKHEDAELVALAAISRYQQRQKESGRRHDGWC